ncbi:MAG TPA: type II toxin-antitoxin system VapC family toxin [Chthoniobacterales bacterium]|nr:type II toxin-antitoxin system VapC family toxin [Chthoniobacterales bacterium]
MIYFDAAYIAKFYLDEPDSDAVRSLAEANGEVACCLHGRIEVLIAFHRKLREGAFTAKIFAAVVHQFEVDCESAVWSWLPISTKLITTVSERIRQLNRGVFLRSADALHLASASEQGFHEIYSNDRHLLAAATHFGLRGLTV